MNRHLNLFKAFSQNLSHENIEDNLSRALVICLQNNSLLFHEFLKKIFSETGQIAIYNSIFTDVTELDNLKMDLQVKTDDINSEEFRKVFAIAISGRTLDMSSFYSNKANKNKSHITDILITINDIAIVIEVKRNDDDCRSQLYQQVAAFTECVNPDSVYALDFNWKKLMEMVTQVNGFQILNRQNNRFLVDFIDLVKSHNQNWLPVAPFVSIANIPQNKDKFKKRMEAALSVVSEDLNILDYSDRIGLQISNGWASEIVINVQKNNLEKLDLRFGIWPGNTKAQGWKMLNELKKHSHWAPPQEIIVNNERFNVNWGYEIKFCHFNRFITNIVITDKHIKDGKSIISSSIHNKYTGKYKRDEWSELESFLDEYIKEDFNWRKYMKWEKNFLQTNRNYLTLSIGYEIETIIPVDYVQKIDTQIDNLQPLSKLITDIQVKYEHLFKMKVLESAQ
ncbi:hypothetical protein EGY05_18040 [Chryseobacterium arthrosphaerae]|uniref:hypothetical protein n=1 Tax=Chryseobacterium arthrosphaerae TaxID=651561 RepID=UPI000F4F88CB|nr:hypothetical protein [Chryseobacterium arthrosphaerae]AYZ13723.1 hypothetical protein EGY05_18040 [Chryseobacterium arthrosphaerae]